jgi:hypothetical protein
MSGPYTHWYDLVLYALVALGVVAWLLTRPGTPSEDTE